MRIFFDICDDGTTTRDQHGAEMTGVSEAVDTAASLLVDLARDALADRTSRTLICVVRDRDDAVVHRAELMLRSV